MNFNLRNKKSHSKYLHLHYKNINLVQKIIWANCCLWFKFRVGEDISISHCTDCYKCIWANRIVAMGLSPLARGNLTKEMTDAERAGPIPARAGQPS